MFNLGKRKAEVIVEQATDPVEASQPLALEKNERRTRSGFIPKIMRVAGHIPFADDLTAAYYCAIDRKTPLKAKAVLFAALAYFIIPTDLVPDIIAGLGFTDDATVLAATLGIVSAHIQPRHRRAARRLLGLKAKKDALKTPSD